MEKTTYFVCAIIILLLYVSSNGCRCDDSLSGSGESSVSKKNSTALRYCGNTLIRAMRLICDGYYAEQNLKRSLDQPKRLRNRRHKIWKQKFNIKDTDLVTLNELDSQYQLLFGSEVHTNHNLPYVSYYRASFQEPIDLRKRTKRTINRMNLVRKKRGIYEECCAKPCTINYLKEYCFSTI